MTKSLPFSGKLHTRWLIFLIISIVIACYLPTLNNGFVWDDNANFIENTNYRGLSWSHLYWMFTTYHDANYHPLAWLTLGFDFVLWDMNPAGYHLTNIVLHAINSVLFYFLIAVFIRQATMIDDTRMAAVQIGAFCGALFFAVHPLRVETVAWISTRGDLLCGIFYILTIITYLKMNASKDIDVRRRLLLLALLFFIFSLLSRAWGITMPVVLLLLDIYPLRRFDFTNKAISSHQKPILEKIPFLLLALAAGLIALQAKRDAMSMVTGHGVMDRFMQAAYGLSFYLYKTFVPMKLSPFYLLSKTFNPMEAKYILSVLFVVGIFLSLTAMRRRWPWALTAWVCYIVVVSPLLGFVQSGNQIAADRYTYIACMPFGVLAGAGIFRLWTDWQGKRLFAAMTAVSMSLLVLAVMSFRQTGIWHDNATFLNHILKLDPNNYIAYYARGLLHDGKGESTAALADYTSVIRLDPEHAKAYNNRGVLRKNRGDTAGAMDDFNTAIRLAPFSPEAYANRGMIHLAQKDLQKAFADFTKVIQVASAAWPHRAVIEKLHISLRKRLEERDKQY